MDRQEPERPGPAPGPRRRRWPVPAALFGGVAALALLAWLSAPAWLPMLAAGQLPEGWRLDALTLERPGLEKTRIERARVVTELAGLTLSITAEDTEFHYDGPRIDVRRVTVDARRLPPDPTDPPVTGGGSLDDLALPRLLPPGGLPAVRIREAVLNWEGATPDAEPRRWRFSDLELDPAQQGVQLDARLDPPNGFAAALALALDLSAERLALTVMREGRSPPLLSLSQVGDFERGDTLAEVELDIDLSWLEPGLLAPVTGILGPAAPDAAEGRLRATATLRGEDELHPERVAVTADGLRLHRGGVSVRGDFELAAVRDGDRLDLVVDRLALALEGAVPGIDERLRPLLRQYGLESLLEAPERSLALRLASPAKMALGTSAPWPLQLAADGALDAQFGSTDVALTLDELALTMPALDRPGTATLVSRFALRGLLERSLLVRSDDQVVGATATAIDLAGFLSRESTGAFRAEGDIGNLALGDFSFSHPAATLRLGELSVGGRFALDDGGVSWAGPVSGSDGVVAPADAIAATSLLTTSALSFDLEVAGDDALVVTGRGRLDGVLLPDPGISLDGVAVDIETLTLPEVDGRLGFVTTGLEARIDDTRYTGIDLDLDGELRDGRRYDGAGELLIGFSGSLPFTFAADLEAVSVQAGLDQAPLPATALGDAARALALPLPKTLTFTDGRLVLNGDVDLGASGLTGELDVRGEALGLNLGESRVEGLDFASRVSLQDVISGKGPLTLRLARLAAGLELVAMDTAVTFSGADVGLLELDAELLGGKLSSPGLQLSGGELMDTLIRWEGFDLGRLLAFVDVSGLEGTGTLNAELPIVNTGGGPTVRDGGFRALGPGVLRYDTGVPATNIGLQALENFQYDSLEGTLAYGSDGAYTVTVDLLGRNPDLYGGHPVRFRLNLGGVMPALFRSLFVTGDFEEAIIERLRAGESPLEETP